MTQAELEALKNILLASGQPITASIHRNWAQKIIDELFNATSRGKVLATTSIVTSLISGDKVYIVRGSDAKLISKDVLSSGINRWNFAANSGAFPTDPTKIYVATDSSVYPENTQFYSMTDTLPTTPTAANFYTK